MYESYMNIGELFEKVLQTGGKNKLLRIFAHIVESPKTVEWINKENAEAGLDPTKIIGYYNEFTPKVLFNCQNICNYIAYLEAQPGASRGKEALFNMKLLVYLQVIETKYIYKVFWNCINVLEGNEIESQIFDDYNPGMFEKFKKKYDDSGYKYECIEKFISLYDKYLRNAIAHNDYYIKENKAYIISSLTEIIQRSEKQKEFIYSADIIEEYYIKAKQLNQDFIEAIREWELQLQPIY